MQNLEQSSALAYLEPLGLNRPPFPLVPDTVNFYQPRRIYILLAEILHCIQQRQGFIVMTGEIGLGKTTLTRQLLKLLERQNIQTALIINTFLQSSELLEAINQDFGLVVSGGIKPQLSALNEFLIEQYQNKINCTLIIDDAQHLSIESLELIRQLSNLETETEKLIQIVLVGQPELLKKLARYELRQLKSRIVLQVSLPRYSQAELKQYVDYKLARASNTPKARIMIAAYPLLFQLSQGNPRKINTLMNRCLYAAVAEQTRILSKSLVKRVAKELEDNHLRSVRILPLFIVFIIGVLISYQFYSLVSSPKPLSAPSVKQRPVRLPPEELTQFLDYYGLKSYLERFHQALQQGDFTAVKAQINQETAMRLIILKQFQPAIFRHFAVLSYRDKISHKTVSLLFWQPKHWLDDFYPGLQDPDITWLQRRLQDYKLYPGVVDGIVGKITQKALLDYQTAMGLDKTGTIDEVTLFYLHQHYLPLNP